jgi:pyridoxal phosphate enzyme (YggS family)
MNSKRETDVVAAALADVRGRIAAAAARAGREKEDIRLLAVTKYVDAGRIAAAVAAGQRLFGENRVQEAEGKIGSIAGDLTWHMIGSLQKNKVRKAVAVFDVIESVDSEGLALQIDRRAREAGRTMPVLLQVNEAGEDAKGGVSPREAPRLIEAVCAMVNLELRGLMAIPPWGEAEESRRYFAGLRGLRDRWDGECCPAGTLRELSMGMTGDFEAAVEEGATIVRVGSAIFGSRPGR